MAFATALRVPIMGAARIAPAPARRNRATTTPRTARMNAVSALAPRPAPHYNSSGSSNGHRAAAAASRASRRLAAAAAAPAVRTPAALRSAAVAVEANLFARLARIARAAIQNFTVRACVCVCVMLWCCSVINGLLWGRCGNDKRRKTRLADVARMVVKALCTTLTRGA